MVVRFAQRFNASAAHAPTSMNQILATQIYRFLGARFWRPFSQVVFPIYLFHFPLVAIAGTLSLGLGIVLHILIEHPMIRIGAKYLLGSTPHA